MDKVKATNIIGGLILLAIISIAGMQFYNEFESTSYTLQIVNTEGYKTANFKVYYNKKNDSYLIDLGGRNYIEKIGYDSFVEYVSNHIEAGSRAYLKRK